MGKTIFTGLMAIFAAAAIQSAAAAEKGTPSRDHVDANGIQVSVGADWVSPAVRPETFFLDARTRPVVPEWKPGDPIKEIPRLFNGDPEALNLRAKPVNPVPQGDLLVELQRAFGPGAGSRAFTTPLVNQDAQGFSGVSPPDPTGDVGGGFYVQSINGSSGRPTSSTTRLTARLLLARSTWKDWVAEAHARAATVIRSWCLINWPIAGC